MGDSDKNGSINTENQNLESFENKTMSPEKMRCRKTRKRKKPPSDDENSLDSEKESEIDISLEKKLRECAKRNNLSPLEVKKLLRKIVGNDHVLALVKLQEEEELNREASLKTPLKDDQGQFSDKEKDIDSTPKLTRAKAKALNKKPVSLPSLSEIEPEPEVTALITDELNTDDEDEDDEYEPKEDDYIYSEDDFNTTASDLDSQPRTPMTNISYSEVESPIVNQSPKSPIFSTDGVFKIPRERTLSGLTREDEIIAKRTRSKFCLQTTSIEALESTFIPPDITKDMYEFDQEVDQDWAQFLNEFTKPLNNTTVAEEDDPEEDPEYVATDKVPIDAEELKDINISKKELNDLVAELFDGLLKEGVFLEDIPDLDTPRKPTEKICQRAGTKSPPKKRSKFCAESQPIFTSPSCERFSENHFQMPEQIINSENQTQINCNTSGLLPTNNLNNSIFLNSNVSIFTPNVMSTPSANSQIVRTSNIETPQPLQKSIFGIENVKPSISTTALQFTQTVVQVNKTKTANELPISATTQTFCDNNINQPSYNLTQSSATEVINSVPSDVRLFPYEVNFNTSPNIITTNTITNIESQQSNKQATNIYQNQSPINELAKTIEERNVTLIAYPANGGPPCYKVVPLSSISLIGGQSSNLINNQSLITTLRDINSINSNEIVDLTNCEDTPSEDNLETTIRIASCLNNYKLGNTGLRTKSGFVSHPDLFEMWKGDAHKSSEKYYKKLYEKKYNEMLTNRKIPESRIYKNHENTGFTSKQKQLFEQQLRIHVQFLTQNYLQTYSHPQFWSKAKSQKDMLLELKQKSDTNNNSAFNAWNLKESINLINEWETELAEVSEENQKFMEFIYHQIDRYESNKRPCSNRVIKFPPKTLKKILQSNVFLYPELLPRLPFRNSNHPEYHDLAPIESHLLALELEKYLPGVEKQIKEEHRKNNAVKLACDKISYDIIKGKTGRRLYDFYKQELNSEHYNPLKYFDERKCAPPFQHNLIPIDFNCVLPPTKHKQLLPMLWKEFATELETKELIKNNDKISEIEWSKKLEVKQKRKERKEYRKERKKEKSRELKKKKSTQSQQNVVINLNYVLEKPNQYDINLENGNCNTNNFQLTANSNNTNNAITKIERRTSGTDYSQVFTKVYEPLDIKFGDDASYLQHLNAQYLRNNLDENITILPLNDNCHTNELSSNSNVLIQETSTETHNSITKLHNNSSGQKRLTDYFSPTSCNQNNHNNSKDSTSTIASNTGNDLIKIILPKSIPTNPDNQNYQLKQHKRIIKIFKLQNRGLRFSIRRSRYGYRSFKIIKRLKERKRLKNKLKNLFIRYWKYLHQICNKYENILLKKCYVHFKKLEIYSDFLETLKKICEKTLNLSKNQDDEILVLNLDEVTTKHLPQIIGNDITSSETCSTGEENLIQIIMPPRCNSDISHDEFSNTSHNLINANNFFEKVEERFCRFGKDIKFRKFLSILKSFDPDRNDNDGNSTIWLYNKMEKLFLPEYSDLAEIFLHFLLPTEAHQASNFLRNYMINNKDTFVQHFQQYFNEYPKKIPEIYQCLNELSDQNIEPTTEKIKFKLSALVSDNIVLNKWLQQIFVDEKISESHTTNTLNSFRSIHSLEHQTSITFDAKDLICDISELQPSEFRYVNARLLSVSKVFLPEVLAKIANSLTNGETVAIVSLNSSPQNNTSGNSQMEEINNENQNNSQEILIENCPITNDQYQFNNIKDLIENVNLEENEIDILHEKVENNVQDQKNQIKLQQNYFKDKEIIYSEPLVEELVIENLKIENRNFDTNPVESELNNSKENVNRNDKKLKKPNKNILENSQKHLKNKTKGISHETATKCNKPKRKITTKKSLEDENIAFKVQNNCTKTSEKNSIKVENEIKSQCTNQNISWTIDEDRIILEEARLDFDLHEDLLNKIALKINGKTCSEIDKRYKFLINLLSQLKK